jgi:hypothetical protein
MGCRGCALVCAVLGAALLVPSVAIGGTYDVQTCATPAGRLLNHAWILSGSGNFNVGEACNASAPDPQLSVVAQAGGSFGGGESKAWTFTAPQGSSIANFRIHHQLYQYNPVNSPSTDHFLYTLVQLGSTVLEATGDYSPPPPTWWNGGQAYDTHDLIATKDTFPASANYRGDARTLRVAVGCQTGPCSLRADGATFAKIVGATVTIGDPTAPKVDRVYPIGLAAGGSLSGDEPLTFDASDNSGIQRAELVDVTPGADSKVVGTKAFGCDYSFAAPCPQAAAAEITATDLASGQKTLVLRLTDAAGNVGQSAPFAVQAEGPLNGTPASAAAKLTAVFARNRRSRLTVNYGGKATVRGRVTDAAGTPIAGATVQVLDRELRIGTRYAQRAEVTTGADGRFTVGLVPGAARAFRLEYRTRRFSSRPAASKTVSLRVRAGVTLSISPHRIRAGGTIRLSGRLKGVPLPKSGKVVDLQAYDAGRWRTFDTVRARRGARYTARYHFLRAPPGRTFQFRARVRRDDSYPYYLGYSRRARVRVG